MADFLKRGPRVIHTLEEIFLGAHPEGVSTGLFTKTILADVMFAKLKEKVDYIRDQNPDVRISVITQLSFNIDAIHRLHEQVDKSLAGVRFIVGIPGPVGALHIMRYGWRIGIGKISCPLQTGARLMARSLQGGLEPAVFASEIAGSGKGLSRPDFNVYSFGKPNEALKLLDAN